MSYHQNQGAPETGRRQQGPPYPLLSTNGAAAGRAPAAGVYGMPQYGQVIRLPSHSHTVYVRDGGSKYAIVCALGVFPRVEVRAAPIISVVFVCARCSTQHKHNLSSPCAHSRPMRMPENYCNFGVSAAAGRGVRWTSPVPCCG